MALLTVEGVYDHGKIELTETPADAPARARVLVTFLPSGEPHAPTPPPLGQETARREAVRRLLARLEKGIDFGGPPYPKREVLYDRFDRSLAGDG